MKDYEKFCQICQEVVEPLPRGTCPGCYSAEGFEVDLEAETSQPELEVPQMRPTSVTVVGRLLLLLAVVGIGAVAFAAYSVGNRSEYFPFLMMMGVVSVFQVFLGMGILNGENWARVLFLWITPLSAGVGLLSGRVSPTTIFKIAWYLVFAGILTRPRVVLYFTTSRPRGLAAYRGRKGRDISSDKFDQ